MIESTNTITITGKLSYNGVAYELISLYDYESGNLSLSTQTYSVGVEITVHTDMGGKAIVKTKSGNGWNIDTFDVAWYELGITDAVDESVSYAPTPGEDLQGIYSLTGNKEENPKAMRG
jgi:hypothetical protein